MTSGTRILLLIIALFVGILILYYGFLMPPVAPRGPETAETAAPAVDDPAPTRSSAVAGGAAEPAAAAQTEQATERATDDDGAGVIPPPAAVAKTLKGASPGPRAGIEGRTEGGTDGAAEAVSPAGHGVLARDPVHRPAAAVDPPPAAADRSAAGPPRYMRYVVKDGDTMSSIAMWWFGEAGKWDLIAKANLVDPNRLSIGQVLRLPARDAARSPLGRRAGSTPLTHVVGSGDTLSSISGTFYGDIGRWRVIYQANRALIGADPDRLAVGMRLVIPAAR